MPTEINGVRYVRLVTPPTDEQAARGLIARAMPHGDILGFAPPLVANREDIETIVAITRMPPDGPPLCWLDHTREYNLR